MLRLGALSFGVPQNFYAGGKLPPAAVKARRRYPVPSPEPKPETQSKTEVEQRKNPSERRGPTLPDTTSRSHRDCIKQPQTPQPTRAQTRTRRRPYSRNQSAPDPAPDPYLRAQPKPLARSDLGETVLFGRLRAGSVEPTRSFTLARRLDITS